MAPCTVSLRPKRHLPPDAPKGEPYLLCSVIERHGKPTALTMTFAPESEAPEIAPHETVAYVDSGSRLLELETTRGMRAPDHIIKQAVKQDMWIELSVPVRVVAWHRRSN